MKLETAAAQSGTAFALAQFLQSKSQSTPSAAIIAMILCTRKAAPVKTILLLSDETTGPTQLLHDATPLDVPLRQTNAVACCNCDRWGHPCPGCTDDKQGQRRKVQNFGNKEQR